MSDRVNGFARRHPEKFTKDLASIQWHVINSVAMPARNRV